MSQTEIERVGDSVVLRIDKATIMLAREDALAIGLGLVKVAMLGVDALDEPMHDAEREQERARLEVHDDLLAGAAPEEFESHE